MGSSRRSIEFQQGPRPVKLSCEHETKFQAPWPKPGELILCRVCDEYRLVQRVGNDCQLRCDSCQLSTRYPHIDLARRSASRHVMRKHSHTVSIVAGAEHLETVSNSGSSDERPYARVLSQRTEQVQRNQGLLRVALDKAYRDAELGKQEEFASD